MRVLQAPTEPLPELARFLEPFRVHFARSEGPAAQGLRTDFALEVPIS
jgi:hypothetical protein